MNPIITAGRIFYGVCLCGLAIEQVSFGQFLPVIIPTLPSGVPLLFIWVSVFSAALLFAGAAIIFDKKTKLVALYTGGIFLAMFAFYQLPYMVFVNPYTKHLGVWTNTLKMLGLAGGAFVMAGSCPTQCHSLALKGLCAIVPAGRIFFAIMMVAFGIDHFLYPEFVAGLVPAWIPGKIFWTYFSGVALIGSGLAIALNLKLELTGLLLGTMLFLWVFTLHIPRAALNPTGDLGNELTSVFEALGFSGTAFVLAFGVLNQTDSWEEEKRIAQRFQD